MVMLDLCSKYLVQFPGKHRHVSNKRYFLKMNLKIGNRFSEYEARIFLRLNVNPS